MSNSTHFFSKAILIFCLAICFSLPQLKAQKAVYDSLYQVYLTETNDSIKSATLSRVIRWMIRTDPDSAIVLANRNIAYGENNQLALIIGQGKLDIAQASVRLGKYEESLALNEEAKAIFEAYPDSNLLSVAYQGIGISYRHLGRFEAAMRAQHRVIEIREKIGGSPQPLARAYNNIASIYTEIGENPKALDYFQKSLDIWRKEKNPESMAICYINMGAQAIFMDSLPLAETYLRRGYQTFDSLGLKYGTGAASANLGKLYMDKGMWSEAKEQYQAALKSYEDLGDIGRQAMFLSDLGLIESELKNFSQAVAYQETSLKKAKEAKRITAIRDSYERLADLYEEAGQYEKAYPALKGFYTFADSVYADDTRAKIEELELKYAGEKKDQEIDFLKKEQELQAQQQLWLLAGLASLFLLTAIIVYAFFNAKRANQKLQIAQEKAQELIQEKEALIEQLKQTQIQLIQKEKMASLGQLSAGIAHEINNPANFVSGNAEALNMDLQEIKSVLDLLAQLKKEGQSSKLIASLLEANEKLDMDFLQKEILQLSESIQRGSSRIQNIVGSLKSFSHSSGEEFQDAQLNELIDSTLTILTHKLKLKETELEKEYAELPEILCQPGKISQVCMNLLDNAIDAIDRHGKISIKSWQEGEDVFLRIQDDGSGIDEATRSKIFDPFFTTKEIGEGSGLGLSISYGIVKDHGGSIELESSPEAGSSFLIRLPLGGT